MTAQRFHFSSATLLALLKMSLPMIISQSAFALMIFTDRFFLAQISPTYMAAALGGGVAWFFTISLFNGVLAYANALVAQYYGAGEHYKCSRVVTQGIVMTLFCLPILFGLTFLLSNLFAAMGHEPEQVVLEKSYYSIMMMGCGFTLIKVCFASFFSGIGKTKVVMICDVIGIFLNIPLSYALIFGKFGFPEMGIEGAAISTVASTVFTLLLFILFYLGKANRNKFLVLASFQFDRKILRRYIKLGLPSGLELFLNVAAFNLFLLMFQSYGIPEAASAAIVFNWDMLSFVPMMGLNIGVMSLIGRFVGEGNLDKAKEVTTAGYILGIGYSAMLALSFIIFRHEFVEFFIFGEEQAEEIRALASFMMIGLATYVMAEAVLLVAGGVLRGAGDTKWIMYASVSMHWIMLIAQYLIIKVFDFGPKASWIAFVCMILVISVIFATRLKNDRWRDPEKLKRVMAE